MRRSSDWWAAGAIAVAAMVAYLPAVRGGFVFDDHLLVESSRLLEGPLRRVWVSSSVPDYWPLTWTTLWLEHRLWGSAAWGYHAVNVTLHAATALLLWRVLRRLGVPGARLGALLFAVHPVAVESVAWISERKNVLSGVLFLGAALAWLRHDEDGRRRPLAASVLLFVLACLAKGSVVVLPVVLAGVVLHRRGRLAPRDLAALAPLLAVALVTGLVNLWFQQHNALALGWAPHRGLAERLGGAGWALAYYLRTAYVPADLGFVHAPWSVPASEPLFYAPAVLLVLGFVALAVAARRHRAARGPALAVAYQAVTLAPVLGLVDMAYFRVSPVANHLQYLALMGPVALLGAAGAAAAARSRLAWPVAMAVAVTLALVTSQRAAEFRDDDALWDAAVRDAPASAFARYQRSVQLAARGRVAESLRDLEVAAEVATDPAGRHVYRAMWLRGSGRPADAAAEARAALAAAPSPEVRSDAGGVLLQVGETSEAVAVYRALADGAPGSSRFAYQLANALWRDRQVEAALDLLRRFCRDHPSDPEMRKALGIALARSGRRAEARRVAAEAAGVADGDGRAEELLARWLGGHAAPAR